MGGKGKVLFTAAAIFNWAVAASLFLAYHELAPILGLPPRPTVWLHIVAAIVLVFGYAYWRVAGDSRRFREYIALGIIGKLAFVVVIYAHFLVGSTGPAMAGLVTVDLAFAGLFAWHLKWSSNRLRW